MKQHSHKWDAELTNTFIHTLLALRAELQQSQVFDKIKCKVSFLQECFIYTAEDSKFYEIIKLRVQH